MLMCKWQTIHTEEMAWLNEKAGGEWMIEITKVLKYRLYQETLFSQKDFVLFPKDKLM